MPRLSRRSGLPSSLRAPAAVRKQIAGRPDPIYLLQGEDDVEKLALALDFAELVEEGLRAFNVEWIHAGEMTCGDRLADGVASLVAAVRTLPMMAPRRSSSWRTPKPGWPRSARAKRRPERSTSSNGCSRNPIPCDAGVGGRPTLDKRSRIYKLLAKQATLVDCGSVADEADAERWVRRASPPRASRSIRPARVRGDAGGLSRPSTVRRNTGDVKRLRNDVDRLLLYALGRR